MKVLRTSLMPKQRSQAELGGKFAVFVVYQFSSFLSTRGGGGKQIQILVLGPFTTQIEEWRNGTSLFFGNEKLHLSILARFSKTVIGPFFKARQAGGFKKKGLAETCSCRHLEKG